jgi:hypothetical protein
MINHVDKFAILDQITQTQGVTLVQVNTWLIYILGIFVTVIIVLFVYLNNRFDKIESRFDGVYTKFESLIQTQNEQSIILARIETLVKLSITLKGYTSNQVEEMEEEELKKQAKKIN